MATKDMAESEKNKAQDELTKRETELKSAQEQHEELNKKLKDLQSKVYTLCMCTGIIYVIPLKIIMLASLLQSK